MENMKILGVLFGIAVVYFFIKSLRNVKKRYELYYGKDKENTEQKQEKQKTADKDKLPLWFYVLIVCAVLSFYLIKETLKYYK